MGLIAYRRMIWKVTCAFSVRTRAYKSSAGSPRIISAIDWHQTASVPTGMPTTRTSDPKTFSCMATISSHWVSERSSRVMPPARSACDFLRLRYTSSRPRRS